MVLLSNSYSNSVRAKKNTAEKSPVWHPYTQMKDWDGFDVITKGKGMWLYDSAGNKMLDGVASMWCNVWGHSRKEIVYAMTQQTKRLQHASLFNLTNDKAERLGHKLVDLSPGMGKVFYSDDGSTAMEIALKLAVQYWYNVGEPQKTKFVSLENGYHGDTIGTMSVGYVPTFFKRYSKLFFPVERIPSPNSYRVPSRFNSIDDFQNYILESLENLFKKEQRRSSKSKNKSNKIAAFVMESGAQLAGGVVIYPKGFQRKIQKICKKYNVLFILDEVATGFGRLGSMVEYAAQNSIPDIVAYGKMLTAGYFPLAATLVSNRVYNAFLGQYWQMRHFFHGHTFTGNPVGCATALANLDLYDKKQLLDHVHKMSSKFAKWAPEFERLDSVGSVRHKGMLMGIELVSDKEKKTPLDPKTRIYHKIFTEAKKRGIYLRTLAHLVTLVPPLAISQKELDFLFQGTFDTIKTVGKGS